MVNLEIIQLDYLATNHYSLMEDLIMIVVQ